MRSWLTCLTVLHYSRNVSLASFHVLPDFRVLLFTGDFMLNVVTVSIFCMLKVLMLYYRKEVPKLAQHCIIFLAQNCFFFWGQAPRPQLGRTQPLPRPHPFTLLNIYLPLLTWLRRHWMRVRHLTRFCTLALKNCSRKCPCNIRTYLV